MVRFGDYLLIQYKRILKLLPGIIGMILVVALLLSVAGYAIINSDAYKAEQQRYKIGVVGETDDEMISLGVHMVSTMDDTRFMLELVNFHDEDQAKKAMRNADISAYIVITKEFADALDAMTNDSKLTYYATSGQKGISNVMMDEIAMIATNIIVYSETGICTLRQLMKEEGFDKEVRHEKVNDLFMIYLAALVSRSDVVKVTALGLSDGLSTPEYYFSALLLFFMLLLSFCSISFFLGTKDAQYKFMAAKGIDAPKQVLGEYIPFLTINVILVLFIAAGSKRYQLAGQLLPVAIMFAALGFLIFEVLIGVINKILVAFMLYMGMGYVSGYFYPKTFFPDLVQQIGEKIPTGVAFTYMAAVLQGNSTGRYLVLMLGSTLVFLGLAMFAREQKIK